MTSRERQAWLVLLTMFLCLFFIIGACFQSEGVFFNPLIRYFGGSHARMSALATFASVSNGLCTPLAGWLLDLLPAQLVIAGGVTTVGLGMVVASRAQSFGMVLSAYLLMGIGAAASTQVPAAVVVSNWFDDRRGLALGFVMAGNSLGGTVMVQAMNSTIIYADWRRAYLVAAAPLFFILIPMVLALIRSRPADAVAMRRGNYADSLSGVEVGEALRSRSFWLIALLYFVYLLAGAAFGVHFVPYLIGLGFTPTRSAFVLSAMLTFGAIGKPLFGFIADRVGVRAALALDLVALALGYLILLRVGSPLIAVAFIVLYGLPGGAPLALIPMLLADSLGLKRFGTLSGFTGLFGLVGGAVGPVLAGSIFDAYASYTPAFILFFALLLLVALAPYACAQFEPARTTDQMVGSAGAS